MNKIKKKKQRLKARTNTSNNNTNDLAPISEKSVTDFLERI